jgi:hypothetical protein
MLIELKKNAQFKINADFLMLLRCHVVIKYAPLKGFHYHFTERLQTFSRAYNTGAISYLLDSCRQQAFHIFMCITANIHHNTVTFSAQLIISKMCLNLAFLFATRKNFNNFMCTTHYLSHCRDGGMF